MSVPKLPYSLACKRKESVPLSSKDFIFRTFCLSLTEGSVKKFVLVI